MSMAKVSGSWDVRGLDRVSASCTHSRCTRVLIVSHKTRISGILIPSGSIFGRRRCNGWRRGVSSHQRFAMPTGRRPLRGDEIRKVGADCRAQVRYICRRPARRFWPILIFRTVVQANPVFRSRHAGPLRTASAGPGIASGRAVSWPKLRADAAELEHRATACRHEVRGFQ